jgi:hypothetical protein
VLQSNTKDGKGRGHIEILLDDGWAHDLRDVDHEGWKKQGMTGGDEQENSECSE